MTSRVRERTAALWQRPDLVVLALVLLLGGGLRLAMMVTWRPGYIGYPDSGAYLLDAFDPAYPFLDPLRVVGYGVFIRLLHDLSPNLSVVTLVQHALGLGAALAVYATVRALGVRSRWVPVVPAAVLALSGSLIMLEHAILTEALWLGLIATAVLLVARAARPGRPWVGLVLLGFAGLVMGISVPVRLPGVFAIPVLMGWLLAFGPGRLSRRVAGAGLFAVACLAPVLAFANWHEAETGRFGLSRNGALNLYGRVAPWADCTKFTPPEGTEFLCESRPVRERPGHDAYIFGVSPATVQYSVGNLTNVLPAEGSAALTSWSRAAILGQPLTYLHAVLRESRRVIDPDASPGLPGQPDEGFGLGPGGYPTLLRDTGRDVFVLPTIAGAYPGGSTEFIRGDTAWIDRYEEITRPHPPVMALMIVLALLAPFVTRGPERRAAWLLGPLALVLLFAPVATSIYDFRYIVPVLGFLAAAAAVGGWGVITAARRWHGARRRAEGPVARRGVASTEGADG